MCLGVVDGELFVWHYLGYNSYGVCMSVGLGQMSPEWMGSSTSLWVHNGMTLNEWENENNGHNITIKMK